MRCTEPEKSPRSPRGMPGAWAPLRTMGAASLGSHDRLPSALIPGADHSGVPLRGRRKVPNYFQDLTKMVSKIIERFVRDVRLTPRRLLVVSRRGLS